MTSGPGPSGPGPHISCAPSSPSPAPSPVGFMQSLPREVADGRFYGSYGTGRTVEDLTGRAPRSPADYLADHAADFAR